MRHHARCLPAQPLCQIQHGQRRLCVGLGVKPRCYRLQRRQAQSPDPLERQGRCAAGNSQPVNQQAERIIFSHEEDGSVTAVIQIQYQGPSEQFAWMLPVAGSPEISVSSDAAFTRIHESLRRDANRQIADMMLEMVGRHGQLV